MQLNQLLLYRRTKQVRKHKWHFYKLEIRDVCLTTHLNVTICHIAFLLFPITSKKKEKVGNLTLKSLFHLRSRRLVSLLFVDSKNLVEVIQSPFFFQCYLYGVLYLLKIVIFALPQSYYLSLRFGLQSLRRWKDQASVHVWRDE